MKQFDEEYKEHVRENAPSLWDRIEAGVDEKISITSVSERGTGNGDTARRGSKKKWQRHIRFAMSLAACFAALLLTIPVFRMLGSKHTGEMAQYEATPQSDESIVEEAAKEVPASSESAKAAGGLANQAETAEEAYEEAIENAVTEIAYEGDMAESEAVTDAGEQADLADRQAPEEKQEAASLGDNSKEMAQKSQEECEAETESEVQTGTVETALLPEQCEDAYIQVLEKVQATDGFVYTVEILEDNGKNLRAAQIWKLSAAGSQTEMETGGTYRIQVSVTEPETMQATLCNMQNN